MAGHLSAPAAHPELREKKNWKSKGKKKIRSDRMIGGD
jgi:hypothetical protein